MADRVASAAIVADPRKLDGGLKRAEGRFKKFGKNIKTSIGRSIKRGFSGLSTLGGFATAGGLAIVGRQVLEFENTLNRLQIQSGKSNVETAQLRNQINKMARDTGIAREQILAGANAIINLEGSAGLSAKKLQVLADANLATGTSMEALAGLSFSLANSFELVDPAQLEKGLSAIITAGKEGAIPLNEMTLVLQQVSASFKEIGGTGVQGASDMAASLQVLRRGFGTASEAGTGLQAMITGLTKKSKQLKKKGIEVFDKNGAFRGIRPILDDFEKADLTFKELVDTIGRIEGAKAIKTMLEFRRTKIDPATGKQLIGFEELSKAAAKSNAIQEDAAKRRKSDAFKIQKAFNDVKLAFAEAFTPERIKTFVKVVQKLADLLKWMVDNPLKSLGILFAMKFGPGALGSILSGGGLLGKLAGGGGVSGAAGAAGGKGLGLLGKGGLVAGAGAAGFALGTFVDDLTGASDAISGFLSGVDTDEVRKVEKTKFDPAGRASALREKARQLEAQGVQPELVKAFRAEADKIITGGIRKVIARKEKAFEFKKLFGGRRGSVQARAFGAGEFRAERQRLDLSFEEQKEVIKQLAAGSRRREARAFAAGAPAQIIRGAEGQIVVIVKVDDDGNLTAENSKGQRKGN